MEYVEYVIKILEKHPIPITLFAFGFIIERYLDNKSN